MIEPQSEVIYFSQFPTKKLGNLGVAVQNQYLCFISFSHSNENNFEKLLQHRFPNRSLILDPEKTKEVQKQINDYFAGKRDQFEFSIDFETLGTPFQCKVLETTFKIPFGKVMSYSDVARMVGHPKASRAVGNALAKNPIPIVIPCHRVVASDGSLGGYTGGLEYKRKLLKLEGVIIP